MEWSAPFEVTLAEVVMLERSEASGGGGY